MHNAFGQSLVPDAPAYATEISMADRVVKEEVRVRKKWFEWILPRQQVFILLILLFSPLPNAKTSVTDNSHMGPMRLLFVSDGTWDSNPVYHKIRKKFPLSSWHGLASYSRPLVL